MTNQEFEKLRSDLITHHIYLTRYQKRLGRSLTARFDKQVDFIILELMDALERLENMPVGAKFQTEVKVLNANLKTVLDEAMEGEIDRYKEELIELVNVEQNIYLQLLNPADDLILKTLATKKANTIVKYVPYAGRTIDQWFGTSFANTRLKILNIVQDGLQQGLSIDDMVKLVNGTKKLNYSDGVLKASKTHIETIVRTTALGVTNETHRQINRLNSDIIDGELFVATLDNKTTKICASLDGQKFEVDDGPMPVLHPNCRSIRVPYFDGVDRSIAFRSSDEGSIPATVNFEEFMRGKDKNYQDEYFGKQKAQMFRDGLEIGQMVDKSGKEYTLKELEELYNL